MKITWVASFFFLPFPIIMGSSCRQNRRRRREMRSTRFSASLPQPSSASEIDALSMETFEKVGNSSPSLLERYWSVQHFSNVFPSDCFSLPVFIPHMSLCSAHMCVSSHFLPPLPPTKKQRDYFLLRSPFPSSSSSFRMTNVLPFAVTPFFSSSPLQSVHPPTALQFR